MCDVFMAVTVSTVITSRSLSVGTNTTEAPTASIFRNEAIRTRDICRLEALRIKATSHFVPSPCHSCGGMFSQTRRHGPHEQTEEGAEGSIAA
jgi:hypothetical protein